MLDCKTSYLGTTTFCSVKLNDGLHGEINSYHHLQCLLAFVLFELASLVVNTDIFEAFTGPGFNSTSPDTNKKFLSDVFILCILHLLVPTTLSLTLFDLNNLCFLSSTLCTVFQTCQVVH
jgi:hypothetical protein